MFKLFRQLSVPALILLLMMAAEMPAMAGDNSGAVVNERTGATYVTITEAVEEAEEGDVLTVGTGTYQESVVIDKALVINGETGAVVEGIDNYVFSIRASGVALNGLAMHNEGEAACAVEVDYSGFAPHSPSSWSITNCRMTGGEGAEAGIAVRGDIASPTAILIENNVIDSYRVGIDLAYSYIATETIINGLDFTARGNKITGATFALLFYGLEGSRVAVKNNIMETEADCIPIFSFENSSLTVTGNTMQSQTRFSLLIQECSSSEFCLGRNDVAGAMGFIIFYCHDSTGEIHDNNFSVEDYAISLYRRLADSKVAIFGNSISVGYEDTPGPLNGIYGQTTSGELHIFNNTIESSASDVAGINVWVADDEESLMAGLSSLVPGAKAVANYSPASSSEVKINIEGNRVSHLTHGLALYVSEQIENACNVNIHANVVRENERGLCLDLTLNHADSRVRVFNNLFHGNKRGILLEKLSLASPGAATAFLNSFTGNSEAGIAAMEGYEGGIFNAPLNWWGSEEGPSTADKDTGGDYVTEEVNYAPWLAELKLLTSGGSLKDGGVNTVTATLLDSEGGVVDTDLLEVLFAVTGANSYSEVVKLAGGVATFSYQDRSPGTDTITARLLFAGEAAGSSLESASQTTWEAAELPRTAGAVFPLAGLAGLVCLLAGAALQMRSEK
ncbi:MAG: hypothetical protein GX890_02580 [Firmicutes bacterium]|jgi:hypothetical protein|nr:hypothetical protein [Bacillota bacterium]HPU01739.1 hypothetical protein [Bacillota bacterium]